MAQLFHSSNGSNTLLTSRTYTLLILLLVCAHLCSPGFAENSKEIQAAEAALTARHSDEAVRKFTALANSGNPIAARRLGFIYSRGLGLPEDNEKARYWLQKAADAGDAEAM
ncbi:MAG TPA: hypothetical protein PLI59_20105, partial [Candidatus Obscuribacter sp.]|nr:hypothetical protein [Candidatus Obscuribacter sp.]